MHRLPGARVCAHGAPQSGAFDGKATIDTDKCGLRPAPGGASSDAIQCLYDEAPAILE